MKLLQSMNATGDLILNDFASGSEINKWIYWREHVPYYLTKENGLLIPFNMIQVTNVYHEGDEANGSKKND